jgi:hypothetical protein
MTQTLSQLETSLESMLDQIYGGTNQFRFWSQPEIDTWLNEGARDVARRAESLLVFDTSVAAIAGTARYALPAQIIRIHRVEYQAAGSFLVYPLFPKTIDEMDPIVGINPLLQTSYPYYFHLWGYPPNLGMTVYPVPSQTGQFNLYYYKVPTPMVNPGDICDLPNGWEDLVVTYGEYRARRKGRDPIWKDVKEEYEQKVGEHMDVTRQWHDQQRHIITRSGLGIPSWLYEPSWE